MAAPLRSTTSCMAALAYQVYAIENQVQKARLSQALPWSTEWINRAVDQILVCLREEVSPLEGTLACLLLALEDPSQEVSALGKMLQELPDAVKEKLPSSEEDLLANPRILLMYHNAEGRNFLDACLDALQRKRSLESIDVRDFTQTGIELSDPKLRQRLYQNLINRDPGFFLQGIENIGILSLKKELAQVYLDRDPSVFLANMEKFSLDPSQHFSIAQICAKKVPQTLSDNMHKFSLSDLERKEIAKICLTRDCHVASNVSCFHLSEEARFELFCEFARGYLMRLESLKYFDLTESQKKLFFSELIKSNPQRLVDVIAQIPEELHEALARALLQEHNQNGFWKALPALQLSEESLYALATEMGQKDPRSVMCDINAFRLASKEKRYALARALGVQDPTCFSLNLEKFAIAREDDIDGEISKILLQASPSAFAHACVLWGFSQEERLEHLQDVLSKSVETVCLRRRARLGDPAGEMIRHFNQYEIADKTKRYDLFLELFKRSPQIALDYFTLFEIDVSLHFEIAQFCAEKYPEILANTIDSLVLGETQKIAIAHLCIERGPYNPKIVEALQSFQISNKDAIWAILFRCAQKEEGHADNSWRTLSEWEMRVLKLRNIIRETRNLAPDAQIPDFPKEVEFAKYCAEQIPSIVGANIQAFQLSEDEKFAVAKLCIQYGSKDIRSYIDSFQIHHKKKSIDLVLQYAIKYPEETLCREWCTSAYEKQLPSLQWKLKLLPGIVKTIQGKPQPDGILDTIRDIIAYPNEELARYCWRQLRTVLQSDKAISNYIRMLDQAVYLKLPMLQPSQWEMQFDSEVTPGCFLDLDLDAFLEAIRGEEFLPAQQHFNCWIGMCKKYQSSFTPRQQVWIKEYLGMWKVLNKKTMRSKFSSSEFCSHLGLEEDHLKATHAIIESEYQEQWVGLVTSKLEEARSLGLLTEFQRQLQTRREKARDIKKDIATIRKELQKHKKELKNGDASKGLMQAYLGFMQALSEVEELPPEKQIRCVAEVLAKEPVADAKKRVLQATALCKIKRIDLLWQAIENRESLLTKLQEGLKESDCFRRAVEGIDFTETYDRTLGSMRVPDAWITYGLKIHELQEEEVVIAFQQAIQSILKETLSIDRYSIEGERRQHLQRLRENLGSEKWADWQKGYTPEPCLVDLESQDERFSFQQFLMSKWQHGHMQKGGQVLLHLKEFLGGGKERQQELFGQYQEESAKDSENKVFAAEVQLMKWYLDQPSLEGIRSEDAALIEVIQNLSFFEIANDLKTLLKKVSGMVRVQVVDADDWQDLFLCGTEVAGSCQRIDGYPSLNRCLLGYILDGKNRMIAIKDADSGKIQARAIIRLLLCERKPVLFLEDIYPDPCPASFQKKIEECAKMRARDLGVPLYRRGEDAELTFLQSPAPWEYVDAAGDEFRGSEEHTITGNRVP